MSAENRITGTGPDAQDRALGSRAMADSPPDWSAVLARVLEGDALAVAELNRLLTGFLVQLRAYDFRDEWDDLRQEVLAALVANARAGRLRDPRALVGYARIITRNKFMDRLKRHLRVAGDRTLAWDEECARSLPPPARDGLEPVERAEVWRAVAALPEAQRRAVEEVYANGRTVQEASVLLHVPLGTLKRRLRQALALLRTRLGEEVRDG